MFFRLTGCKYKTSPNGYQTIVKAGKHNILPNPADTGTNNGAKGV